MTRPLIFLALACAALSPAGQALAQDRGPVERQRLLDLAYVIGESHALRQVCAGAGDQFWRARMVRLTEVEQADQAFDAQLRARFNLGFAAQQGQFPQCDAASRRAEQASARKGQALAARLSRTMRTRVPDPTAPDSVAEDEDAR